MGEFDELTPEDSNDVLRARFFPFLLIILVVGIMFGLCYFYRNFPEKINLLKHYGYIGAFLISLFGNGSIFLPATVLPILTSLSLTFFPVTGILGPVFIAIAGGAGAALGETVGYTLGYSGRKIIIKKKTYTRFELWVRRWGAITIFVFSFVPFFFDFVGLAAGALHFPLWKFILISFIGRTIFYFCVFLVTIFGVMKLF